MKASNVSEKLSDILRLIAQTDWEQIAEKISDIQSNLLSLTDLLDDIKAIRFEETDTEYKMIFDFEFLAIVASLFSPSYHQGIEALILKLLFNVIDINELSQADPADFAKITLTFTKSIDMVTGFFLDYNGILDEEYGWADIGLGVNFEFENSTNGQINLLNDLEQYVEAAISVTFTIDIGLKDLFLQAQVFINPSCPNGLIAAYIVGVDQHGNEIANLDAYYDGERLWFDLAGLYDLLGVDRSEINTMYYVEIDFSDLFLLSGSNQFGEDFEDDEFDGWDTGVPDPYSPSGLRGNDSLTLIKIFVDMIYNKELRLDIVTIVDLIYGAQIDSPYGQQDMVEELISYYEDVLSKLVSDEYISQNPDATNAEKAQSVIYELTRLDLSVADIIQAQVGDNGNLQFVIKRLENTWCYVFSIYSGEGETLINISMEIEIIPLLEYENNMPDKDYNGAIDLHSEYDPDNPQNSYNLYYEYDYELNVYIRRSVLSDELRKLFEAYLAKGAE